MCVCCRSQMVRLSVAVIFKVNTGCNELSILDDCTRLIFTLECSPFLLYFYSFLLHSFIYLFIYLFIFLSPTHQVTLSNKQIIISLFSLSHKLYNT